MFLVLAAALVEGGCSTPISIKPDAENNGENLMSPVTGSSVAEPASLVSSFLRQLNFTYDHDLGILLARLDHSAPSLPHQIKISSDREVLLKRASSLQRAKRTGKTTYTISSELHTLGEDNPDNRVIYVTLVYPLRQRGPLLEGFLDYPFGGVFTYERWDTKPISGQSSSKKWEEAIQQAKKSEILGNLIFVNRPPRWELWHAINGRKKPAEDEQFKKSHPPSTYDEIIGVTSIHKPGPNEDKNPLYRFGVRFDRHAFLSYRHIAPET